MVIGIRPLVCRATFHGIGGSSAVVHPQEVVTPQIVTPLEEIQKLNNESARRITFVAEASAFSASKANTPSGNALVITGEASAAVPFARLGRAR